MPIAKTYNSQIHRTVLLFVFLGSLYIIPFTLFSQPEKFYYEGKAGFKDKSGNILIEPRFDHASDFDKGFAVVMLNGKKGFINEKGEYVTELVFKEASLFKNNYAVVSLEETFGYIDKSGKVFISPEYEFADCFSENGLARVKKGGYYFFIDKKNIKITADFPEANNFSEDLAAVKEGDKWGFIDSKGKWIIKPRYDRAFYFANGQATVVIDKGIFLINKKGEILKAIMDHEEHENKMRNEK